MEQELVFNDEVIKKLKKISDSKELVSYDKLESLKLMKDKMSDLVNIGILALECYDILSFNSDKFLNDKFDYTKELKDFLSSYDFRELRSWISGFNYGKDYGDSLVASSIKLVVNENYDSYISLIKFFFSIFSDD